MSNVAKDVELVCSVGQADHELQIRFTVKNVSKGDIHLYDHGSAPPKADLVCDAGRETANVIVGVPPLPGASSVYSKYHPKTTRLGAGQAKQGGFSLPLPLVESGPYYSDDYGDYARVPVGRMRLILDFVRASSPGFEPDPEPRGPIESAACEVELGAKVGLKRRVEAPPANFRRRGIPAE